MTKDQAKIIRLLAKIQNECGKINFNTEHGEAYSRLDRKGFSVSLNYKTLYSNYFLYPAMIEKLESALSELKEYYRMNRIILKKPI